MGEAGAQVRRRLPRFAWLASGNASSDGGGPKGGAACPQCLLDSRFRRKDLGLVACFVGYVAGQGRMRS